MSSFGWVPQPSTAGMIHPRQDVAEAISHAVRRLGARDCAGRMAQEFGDHPQAVAVQ